MDVWKQFEKNVITHSAAHHLMAIDSLIRCHGYARVSDVARLLEITPGSVSLSLKPLKADGFVEQDVNKFLRLSPRGQRLVDLLRARRSVIVKFLCDSLGVHRHQAEIDSCKIEHLLSGETARRLTDFLRYIHASGPAVRAFVERFAEFDRQCERSADGCPCPQQECLGGARWDELDRVEPPQLKGGEPVTPPPANPPACPLTAARAGQWVCVERVDGGRGATNRLAHLGIMPGHLLRMLRPSGGGPVLVEVKGCRLALGQGLARKILIRPAGAALHSGGGPAPDAAAIPAE